MGTSPLTLTSFLLIHCLTLSSLLPSSSSFQISLGGKGTGITIGIGIGGSSPSSPSSPSPSSPSPSRSSPGQPYRRPSRYRSRPGQPYTRPSPSPSRPSSSGPQPSDFPSCFLYRSYFVIQKFKRTITYDPQGISKTWTGYDICNKYSGFFCDVPPTYDKSQKAVASVDFNGNALGSGQFNVCMISILLLLKFS